MLSVRVLMLRFLKKKDQASISYRDGKLNRRPVWAELPAAYIRAVAGSALAV